MKLNENTKVTLTLGQLKRLVKENAADFDEPGDKTIKVTAVDWDISNLANWDDDQPIDVSDEEEHWDDDQIDDSELTDDEKNELFEKYGLPTMDEVIEVPVPADWTLESDDGEVADWLSDTYGFCVNGWTPVDWMHGGEGSEEDAIQIKEAGWSDDPANDMEDGDWEMNPDGTFKRDKNGNKIPKTFAGDIKKFWNKLRGHNPEK